MLDRLVVTAGFLLFALAILSAARAIGLLPA
jgi:hypothetical protein